MNLWTLVASQRPSRTQRAAADRAWVHCESPLKQGVCRCHSAASDAPTSQQLWLHILHITQVLRITHKTYHPALSRYSVGEVVHMALCDM